VNTDKMRSVEAKRKYAREARIGVVLSDILATPVVIVKYEYACLFAFCF
jgi:hypothetical protein